MEGMSSKRMGSRREDLTPPCKDCEKRNPGCHDHCSGFADFQKRRAQAREYMKKAQEDLRGYDPMAPMWRRYT